MGLAQGINSKCQLLLELAVIRNFQRSVAVSINLGQMSRKGCPG
jgi:hypothetical protein